ncbi:hypothetical protein LTR37_015444 [Vermiconidia calcicola]|uniref:Uncharacterized protein n=1 Tax=Vermiconidia calcicola TaxID=1690605 RepID=A0ACC3MQK3_9PEZI|nr:hypothetical protein LTR37_015444 [Vermiconidia calcicola]
MRESRPSQVLRLEIKAISKQTRFDGPSLEGNDSVSSLKLFMKTSLLLPMRLFFTEPIVLVTSIMAATVYGIIYLFSEALTIVYIDGYGFDSRQSSLVMLAIAVGVAFAFLPRIYDVHVAAERRKEGTPLEPEDKLFGFLVAAPVLASGLWWFTCTIPPLAINVSPWLSIASLVLFDSVLSGYLCDTYATYAASANAPMAFLRAILSGVFPLFGHQLFRNVGSNNALFILASVATGYCGVAMLFGVYGKRIRKRSPMAEKTWTAILSTEHLTMSKDSISVSIKVLPDV